MFIGPLSTTFLLTPWSGNFIFICFLAKTAISYKENSLFAYFSKNTVATWFKLSSNVYQMIIYNCSIDTKEALVMWDGIFSAIKANLMFSYLSLSFFSCVIAFLSRGILEFASLPLHTSLET